MPKINMNRKFIEVILISTLLLMSNTFACYAEKYTEIDDRINKGQSKQSIIELLGKPLEIINIVKHNRFIWGPEEEFWDQIPMETRLEVWKYGFSDGHLNLYFINEGGHLDFKAFAPKGLIY